MIKLIIGHDKRNPIESLSLDNAAGLSVSVEGLGMGADNSKIIWGPTQPGTLTGQSRIKTARENGEIMLTVRINGGDGPARLAQLQRDLSYYGQQAAMAQENRHGPPVWLAYRINDGLDLPEPVIGQWSTYTRILGIFIESWPANVMSPGARKMAWDARVRLVTAPYSEGAKQVAGFASGAVRVDSQWGVIVGHGETGYNKFSNPSFSSSTYSTGWTSAGTGVFTAQETRPGLTRSHGSAVLVGAHSGANVEWKQSIATSTARWYVSFYARRLDDQPVTASDCEAIVNGSAVTSYYIDNKDGWYRIFGAANGSAGANDNGVEVKAARSVVVDDFQLNEYPASGTNIDIHRSMPRPFWYGHRAGAAFAGAEPDSATDTTAGALYYDVGNLMSGHFTMGGWFTPTALCPHGSTEHGLFEFREQAGIFTGVVSFVGGSGNPTLRLYKDGFSDDSVGLPTNMQHVPIHVMVVQDTTGPKMYVDGVLVASRSDDEIRTTGGTLTLGYGVERGTERSGMAIDGFRVFPIAMTAAQVLQLYNNEKDVKSNGDIIGMPVYNWTYDGAGSVENDDDSINDDYNHMEIGGVPGDLPAETEFHITGFSGYEAVAFWLGRAKERYNRGAFKATGLFYRAGTTTTDGGRIFEITDDTDIFTGRISVIAIITMTSGITTSRNLELWAMTNEMGPWPFNDDARTVSYASLWGTKGVDVLAAEIEHVTHVGDIWLNYPPGFDEAGAVTVQIESATTMPSQWSIANTVFMPYPNIFVNQQKLVGDTTLPPYEVTVVNGTRAYGARSFGDFKFDTLAQGDGVDVLPGHYNHVYLLAYDQGKQTSQAAAGDIYDPADNFTVTVYITPRYNLPGGPLA